VLKNRPVVIRNLGSRWPICEMSKGEIASRLMQCENIIDRGFLLKEPFGEYLGRWPGEYRLFACKEGLRLKASDFFHFLEQLPRLTAYSVKIPKELESLIGTNQLVPEVSTQKKGYYFSRCFLYNNSYTDWHFHHQDETITTQCIGEKEFLLLPTDSKVFKKMWKLTRSMPAWVLPQSDREFKDVIPIRAVLNPGDSIYIPVFWWHAVESSGFGLTLAQVFSSPTNIQYNLKYAALRTVLYHGLRGNIFLKPMVKSFLKNFSLAAE
ncbi:MAG: cupin-like domain-containing protein, partial [Bdellovibrionales bacterium]|nr:cupin-like domain-containing protein [Bdellovibrionales bacterium]